MKVNTFLSIFIGILFSPHANGESETFKGYLYTVGSVHTPKLRIESSDGKKVYLCRNELAKEIKFLSGNQIKVKGTLIPDQSRRKRNCLSATSYEVTRLSSDNQPIVGVLKKKADKYLFEAEDKKVYELKSLPTKLKDMTDKRLIVDLRQDPKGNNSYEAVSFITHPKERLTEN